MVLVVLLLLVSICCEQIVATNSLIKGEVVNPPMVLTAIRWSFLIKVEVHDNILLTIS
jgi:hypothetical protein